MYQNIDKSEKIYLYDIYKGCYVKMFPSKLDALKFLATNQEKLDWCKEIRNEYLDHINMGNDKENQCIPKTFRDHDGKLRFYYDNQMVDRQYIFIDGLNRIIDFRIYKKEIDYLVKSKIFDFVSYPKRKIKSKYFIYKNNYTYRKDPVPFTGNRYRGNYYRIPKIHSCLKEFCDTEYKEFVRAKRKNDIPDIYYDDPPLRSRAKSKSWKDCTKKKKQYM